MQIKSRNLVSIKIDDIRLDSEASSIKSYSEKRIKNMAKSLQEKGQLAPIYINKTLTAIWDGHTRYLAAKRLGWRKIRVVLMSQEEWSLYLSVTSGQL